VPSSSEQTTKQADRACCVFLDLFSSRNIISADCKSFA
jgi:hypothetical protein